MSLELAPIEECACDKCSDCKEENCRKRSIDGTCNPIICQNCMVRCSANRKRSYATAIKSLVSTRSP